MKQLKSEMVARLKELRQSRENVLANLNCHNGAIEQCEMWLQRITEMEAEEGPPAPTLVENDD